MTDHDYTHLTVIADASGSMNGQTDPGRTRASDATDGIRSMLREQAALPGKLTASVVQFRSDFAGAHGSSLNLMRDAWFAGTGIADSWPGIVAAGSTPLLDALGTVITETGASLEAMPEAERPGKVVVVVATDGGENASREYSRDTVRDMIARQRDDYGWEFVFIGAAFDAVGEAAGIGIHADATLNSTDGNIAVAYAATSGNVSAYRTRGAMPAFSSKQRDEAAGT